MTENIIFGFNLGRVVANLDENLHTTFLEAGRYKNFSETDVFIAKQNRFWAAILKKQHSAPSTAAIFNPDTSRIMHEMVEMVDARNPPRTFSAVRPRFAGRQNHENFESTRIDPNQMRI